jgi:UDP-N-acetylglucosamine:LPS N-acetylglucosamine transferase
MELYTRKTAGLEIQRIAAAGIHGVGWKKLPRKDSIYPFFFDSRRILKNCKPEYSSLPAVISMPMLSPKFLCTMICIPYRTRLALNLKDSVTPICAHAKKYCLPQKIRCDGIYTRSECKNDKKTRNLFGLSDRNRSLFIFGGSKGRAHPIIRRKPYSNCLNLCQIININGQSDGTI